MDKTELVKRLQQVRACYGMALGPVETDAGEHAITDAIAFISSQDSARWTGEAAPVVGPGSIVNAGSPYHEPQQYIDDHPKPAQEAPQSEKQPMIDPDMRDMFATSALIGLLATGRTGVWKDLADTAYHIAKAMLDARQGEK